MDRLAVIIKGFSKSTKELEMDRQYVGHYVTFLTSIAGGAWSTEEDILVLEDPTIHTLDEITDELKPDFLLLILIGHGATQDDKQLFQINETTIIQAGQLALDVNKQLVILESCRTRSNTRIQIVDLKDRIPKFKYGGIVRSPINRVQSKNLHLSLLKECSDGLVICYPCGDNEVAASYYFSFALLRRSFEWHLATHNRYFQITELMQYVAQDVQKITRNKQNPTVFGTIGFPFVLSKFFD